jgi:HEAT repeat protein
MRVLILAALMLSSISVTSAQAQSETNPTFLDRKMSDWLDMLKTDENARRRRTAVTALASIANDHPGTGKEIFAALGRALKNDISAGVRQQIAAVFGQSALKVLEKDSPIDPRNVIGDMTELLRTEKDTEVRTQLATALSLYGTAAKIAVNPLMALLKDPEASVRAAAVDALGRIGKDAKSAAPDIIPLVKDESVPVRMAAIFALGRLEPDDATASANALVPLIKGEKDPELRKMAITSLCLIGDRTSSVVQSVAAGLFDENRDVRQRTALAMAKFNGGIKLVETDFLRVIKTDEDPLVRTYAIRTLCEGFGPDAGGLLPFLVERLKEEKAVEVLIVLVEEIGVISSKNELKKELQDMIVASLREYQRSSSLKLREAAIESLKRIQKGLPKPKP